MRTEHKGKARATKEDARGNMIRKEQEKKREKEKVRKKRERERVSEIEHIKII